MYGLVSTFGLNCVCSFHSIQFIGQLKLIPLVHSSVNTHKHTFKLTNKKRTHRHFSSTEINHGLPKFLCMPKFCAHFTGGLKQFHSFAHWNDIKHRYWNDKVASGFVGKKKEQKNSFTHRERIQ